MKNKSNYQKSLEKKNLVAAMLADNPSAKQVIIYSPGKMASHLCISEMPGGSHYPKEQLAGLVNDFIYHYEEARHNKMLVQKAQTIILELISLTASAETLSHKNLLIIINQEVMFAKTMATSTMAVIHLTDNEMSSCLNTFGNVNSDLIDEMIEAKMVNV